MQQLGLHIEEENIDNNSSELYLSLITFIMYICNAMVQLRIEKVKGILNKEISVVQASKELYVSRNTVHRWLCKYKKWWEEWLYPKKPWPKSGSPINRTERWIEDIVIELAKTYRFKGPITLWDLLEDEYNIKLNCTTIFRILKRRWYRYHDSYKRYKRPRKLYVLGTPGQEMQLDVSFPMWYEWDVVVYDIIDDCSRIVKTRAYERRNIESSINFIKYILKTTTISVKRIRTDNGWEFGKRFTEYIEELWIKHIRNSVWTPEENGKIERYHRTRKEEDIYYRRHWITVEEANYRLKLREQYYNNKRRHRWLGMNWLTPIQKYDLCSLIKV